MSEQNFTPAELELIAEALDSHLYWQLADPAQRDSGNVTGDLSTEQQACSDLEEKVRRMCQVTETSSTKEP